MFIRLTCSTFYNKPEERHELTDGLMQEHRTLKCFEQAQKSIRPTSYCCRFISLTPSLTSHGAVGRLAKVIGAWPRPWRSARSFSSSLGTSGTTHRAHRRWRRRSLCTWCPAETTLVTTFEPGVWRHNELNHEQNDGVKMSLVGCCIRPQIQDSFINMFDGELGHEAAPLSSRTLVVFIITHVYSHKTQPATSASRSSDWK